MPARPNRRRRTRGRLLVVLAGVSALTTLAAPAASGQPILGARSTFSGTVVNGAGEAILSSGLTLALFNSSNSRHLVPVQADGTFTTSVQPGLFSLAISGKPYADLNLSVRSATGALDLSGSKTLTLTLPTATLTATVTGRGAPVADAQVALASPGCTKTSFAPADQLTVTGKWDEGGAAPAVTDTNGVATRTVLDCSVETKYTVTPPSGSTLNPTTATVAAHTGNVDAPVMLFPPLVDRAAAAGLYEVNMTWSAKAIDANQDGIEDVWVGYHQRSGKLWQGNGDGTYTRVAADAWPAKNPEGTATDRHDCDWADVDHNGLLDAACAAGRDSQNYVKPANRDNELWLQTSPGHFNEVGTQWGLADQCGRGRHVAFVDLNHDGWADLFVGNEVPRDDPTDPCRDPANNLPNFRSKFYINEDGHGFRYAPELFDPGYYAQRCAKVLDYNGDGYEDLLTCNNKDQPPALFRNDGGTGFTNVSAQAGLTAAISDVDVIDLNGDGKPDLVNAKADRFDYQLNQGDGTFGAPITVYNATRNGDPLSVAVGDVDGNGTLDFYLMFGRKANVANADDLVLLNTGTGYVPETVPSATGKADHVLALHPNGPDQPAQFLVMNGYQSGETRGVGGPIQLITAGS